LARPIELTSTEMLQELYEESHTRPVLLYKHSVSCPISGHAWYEVDHCLQSDGDAPTCYRVTVQHHPEISREVAATLDVLHHTPQIIVVRGGKASYVASHWQIRKQTLERALMESALPTPE
jgi:bacillithiol system protein YtxJ